MFQHQLQSVILSAVLIAIFAGAEIFWPAGRWSGIRGYTTNIAVGLIVAVFAAGCAVLLQLIAALLPAEGLIGVIVGPWRWEGLSGVAFSVLVYGLTWDFFQYWFHRWQHQSAVLWPSHRLHHSDPTVNTTTALRRTVLELYLIFLLVLLPTVIVAGVDVASASIAFAIFYGWGFFNHANVRLSLGPLTPLLSGPEWHRLHHALDRQYRDRNFAAYFPLIDLVFGTYCSPPRQAPEMGVRGDDGADALRDCVLPISRARFATALAVLKRRTRVSRQ